LRIFDFAYLRKCIWIQSRRPLKSLVRHALQSERLLGQLVDDGVVDERFGSEGVGRLARFDTELLRKLPDPRRPQTMDTAEARRARVVQCSGVPDREGKARSERTNDSEQTSRTSSITTERSLPLGHRVRLRGLASSVRSSLAG